MIFCCSVLLMAGKRDGKPCCYCVVLTENHGQKNLQCVSGTRQSCKRYGCPTGFDDLSSNAKVRWIGSFPAAMCFFRIRMPSLICLGQMVFFAALAARSAMCKYKVWFNNWMFETMSFCPCSSKLVRPYVLLEYGCTMRLTMTEKMIKNAA